MSKAKCAAYPLIMAALMAAVTAQFSPVPAPEMPTVPAAAPGPGGLDCFQYLIGVSDCLTFVEGGSNLTKPDPGCCPELAKLVDTQPICLCQLLANPDQVGIKIDMKKALQLPSACNVTTPSVTLCSAVGVPVGSLTPTGAPAPSPGGGVEGAPPSGGAYNLSPKISLVSGLGGGAALFFTFLL